MLAQQYRTCENPNNPLCCLPSVLSVYNLHSVNCNSHKSVEVINSQQQYHDQTVNIAQLDLTPRYR